MVGNQARAPEVHTHRVAQIPIRFECVRTSLPADPFMKSCPGGDPIWLRDLICEFLPLQANWICVNLLEGAGWRGIRAQILVLYTTERMRHICAEISVFSCVASELRNVANTLPVRLASLLCYYAQEYAIIYDIHVAQPFYMSALHQNSSGGAHLCHLHLASPVFFK